MLDFLWVDSFFGNFTTETFPFLENNVTFLLNFALFENFVLIGWSLV